MRFTAQSVFSLCLDDINWTGRTAIGNRRCGTNLTASFIQKSNKIFLPVEEEDDDDDDDSESMSKQKQTDMAANKKQHVVHPEINLGILTLLKSSRKMNFFFLLI